jgi:hypothetical protein
MPDPGITFILSLAGLAIFIFLLTVLQSGIQQWLTSGRPINQITLSSLTTGFTFLAAVAALASGWIFYGQLQEMREEKRAWVGPISAGFPNGLPQAGNPANVSVQYHNTGREPAIDVYSDLSPYYATLTEDLEGIPTAHIAEYVAKCRTTQPVIGAQVVFPTTGFSSYNTSRVIEEILIDWNLLYGTSLLYITGCYVYNTLGVTHRTSFCFWFQNGPKMTPQSWVFCPTGNYAD